MWYRSTQYRQECRQFHDESVRLSLGMIVRDNERIISPCLESIRPWVDEMVVVDTGSVDATPRIAQSLGAKVHYFEWCDDFSAARNESLRHARGQWLFWMDSDDTIDAANGRRLRMLADGPHDPATLGYVMQVHCPGSTACEFTSVDQVKLFRNLPDLRFDFRIHEQLLPAMRRLGGQLAWTDIFVVHSGSDHSSESRQRKYERDLRILGREAHERPDHPFVLFNLGMTHEDMGNYEEACHYLQRCLEVSGGEDSHVRKAYALLVSALHRVGQSERAWEACLQGRQQFPRDPELAFRAGILAHERGNYAESEGAYLTALENQESRHFSSLDPGVHGIKARHNLALLYFDLKKPDCAERQCRRGIQDEPSYGPIRNLLIKILLDQRRFIATEIEIEGLSGLKDSRCDAMLLSAELAEHRGHIKTARGLLESAEREFPDVIRVLQSLCRHLFYHGGFEEAKDALLRLRDRNPSDPSVSRNLDALLSRQNEFLSRQSVRGPSAHCIQAWETQGKCQGKAEAMANATVGK